MAKDKRIAKLSQLLDWAMKRVVPALDRYKMRPELVTPSELYVLCYDYAHLLYSLYEIDLRLITKSSNQHLSQLSGLNFGDLKNWDYDEFKFGDATPAVFWGKVLNKVSGWNFRKVESWQSLDLGKRLTGVADKTDAEQYCRRLTKYTFCDESVRFAADEKWARKQKQSGNFIRASGFAAQTIMNSITDALIDCPLEKSPEIRCQILKHKLANFKNHFIWEAVAIGPYIWGHDGLWEGEFGENKGKISGCLSVDFDRTDTGIRCWFRPENSPDFWEWGRLIDDRLCSALGRRYYHEDKLFETWAYDSGKCISDPNLDKTAYWIIPDVEWRKTHKFEDNALEMERLASPLRKIRSYDQLVERFLRVIRSGRKEWRPCHVRWTYIKDLDGVVEELEAVCGREQQHSEFSDEQEEHYPLELHPMERELRKMRTADNAELIPAERRTKPMSISEMAGYWGIPPRKLATYVRRDSVKTIKLGREDYIFDTAILSKRTIEALKKDEKV